MATLRKGAPLRALCFDLESRPSSFWYERPTAEITAIGWKWLDEPGVQTLVLTTGSRFITDDGGRISKRRAFERFTRVLRSAGIVYGHNIRRFDLPLFQAGLMRLELPLLPPLRTSDTLRDFPRRQDMPASLDDLAALFRLVTERGEGKMHLSKIEWERANQLEPGGVELARERVTSDVLLQEQLRQRLLELDYLRPARMWTP